MFFQLLQLLPLAVASAAVNALLLQMRMRLKVRCC